MSHHDLMRCFERMLRRAALPFHSTAGFNPKPRLVFALSLALGIVGCEEVVELEFVEGAEGRELRISLPVAERGVPVRRSGHGFQTRPSPRSLVAGVSVAGVS